MDLRASDGNNLVCKALKQTKPCGLGTYNNTPQAYLGTPNEAQTEGSLHGSVGTR